jgi:hypothetical protein
MPGANLYTQEMDAVDLLAALPCPKCAETHHNGEGKGLCPECLGRAGLGTKLLGGLMTRCPHPHDESGDGDWICGGAIGKNCQGTLFLPKRPSEALRYLVYHEHLISLKHTVSGAYQVQWGNHYGTAATPLLAIAKAIMGHSGGA